ncbi:hypothetical protein X975_19495, partial [Stegodyphus mimosarum]
MNPIISSVPVFSSNRANGKQLNSHVLLITKFIKMPRAGNSLSSLSNVQSVSKFYVLCTYT